MKKNTSKHTYEVKKYDYIREFIKQLFFMPNINADKYKDKKSRSLYYHAKKQIEYYIEDALSKYKRENTTYSYIRNDLYNFPINFLLYTYRFATYSINDLKYYFMIMQNMRKEKFISINEIIKNIKDLYKIEDNIYNTINRKLKELIALGYLEYKKEKGQIYYSLTYNILSDINDEIETLYDMVSFFCNIYFLSVAGYDLLHSIEQERILEYKHELPNHYKKENNIFVYRYNPIFHVLDNNIVWDILKAIENKQIIEYSYVTQHNKTKKCSLLPIKIIIEYEYGRQYIYGLDINNKQYFYNRIDALYELKISNKYNDADIKYDFNMNNIWTVADNKSLIQVRIYFYFPKDDTTAYKILKRDLENTMRFGNITEDNDKITFDIEVNDYMEMIPWINSFGEYALVDKDICPELYAKIQEHTKELMEQYGII